jgi:hypothetical protein
MQALALSNSPSREDMARAAGLAKSHVDQIIRELTEEDQRRRNSAASRNPGSGAPANRAITSS